ncbi:MAG: extracellular solute-binding protein [Candidatus Bathyarchaeota archaeon]|nr:MAG: extracellular solute-binding protein [Candidatus Bathyarchaeota archaeon]
MKKKLGIIITVLYVIMLAMGNVVGTVNAEPDAELVIISPHWEGIQQEFEAAFNTYYQATYGESVDISWLDVGGTSDDLKYIESGFEVTPEGIGIDVFWGGGVDPYIVLADEGYLEAYQVEADVLDKIPATFAGIPMYDSEYRWYGSALSGFGIVYNKALLKLEGLPTPNTWEDLTDPQVKGWVGSADPSHSGSTHMMYEIILQAYGWEDGIKLATMMGANIKTFPQSSSAIPKSVGAGDIAYGLAIDFYAWSEVAKVGAENVGYVMPDGLTVINPDSIAILKGAPNLEVAQRFLTYVLSEEGQTLWMLPEGAEGGPETYMLGRMCVIPELFEELADVTVVPINPFQVTSTLEYDADLGSSRWSLVNDLVGATIIDSHEDLVSAWSEIIATEKTLAEAGITSDKIEEAKDKLGEAPLTLTEALAAVEEWGDAEVRNQYLSDWHSFALTKYESATDITALARTELTTHIESEKEELETGFATEKEALEAQISALISQHESDLEALETQYEAVIDQVKSEKTSSMYTGLGGGAIVGLIVGFAASYYMSRQKEVSAVQA